MIRYSLNFEPAPFQQQINFGDKIALLGSCFTEHIAKRLDTFHFNTMLNPNGIVFNPVSLADPIFRMLNGKKYSESDLFFIQDRWVSLYHHGKYSADNSETCLRLLNQQQQAFETFIEQADWLIITFGSACVYELIEKNTIVANCHKIPQTKFKKRCLSIEEIVIAWRDTIIGLKGINPAIKIIFTVSPVKHLRDGVHENNLSKSVLLLAVDHLLSKDVFYFPSYELVLDDLRDYRFYDSDGAHPNEMAINYVFEKFRQSAMNQRANEIMDSVQKYIRLKDHKPLDSSDENIIKLNDSIIQLLRDLKSSYKELEDIDF